MGGFEPHMLRLASALRTSIRENDSVPRSHGRSGPEVDYCWERESLVATGGRHSYQGVAVGNRYHKGKIYLIIMMIIIIIIMIIKNFICILQFKYKTIL